MDISVIIPCNKNRGYLNAAILSATGQAFRGSFEVILSSQDERLAPFSKMHKIIYNLAPKGNLSININDALKKAKGKYIKFLHEDDILVKSCISDLYDNIGKHAMICANAHEFGEGKHKDLHRIVRSQVVDLNLMLKRNYVHGGTTMFLRSALFDVGLYDERIISSEDWDMYLKLLVKGYSYTYLNKVVYWYRRHPNQKSVPSWGHDRIVTKNFIRRKYADMYSKP